jgi:hypothetical protein
MDRPVLILDASYRQSLIGAASPVAVASELFWELSPTRRVHCPDDKQERRVGNRNVLNSGLETVALGVDIPSVLFPRWYRNLTGSVWRVVEFASRYRRCGAGVGVCTDAGAGALGFGP